MIVIKTKRRDETREVYKQLKESLFFFFQAAERSRVFLMGGSGAGFVRAALQTRGWLQKVEGDVSVSRCVRRSARPSITFELKFTMVGGPDVHPDQKY